MISVTALLALNESTRSDSPPLLMYSKGSFFCPVLLSSTRTLRPGTMKHVLATRWQTSSKSISASGSKTSRSGQNRIRDPVFFVFFGFASV